MSNCIFCDIANKKKNADLLFENESLVVIRDIFPKAPVHLLVIPKKHIATIHHLGTGDETLVGEVVYAAKEMAERQGIGQTGYKLIFNVGKQGGQTIDHIHLHILGGKQLKE